LSVEADQERLIWLEEIAVPAKLVGADGGVVSTTALVSGLRIE
jgi:hypothetical protein